MSKVYKITDSKNGGNSRGSVRKDYKGRDDRRLRVDRRRAGAALRPITITRNAVEFLAGLAIVMFGLVIAAMAYIIL